MVIDIPGTTRGYPDCSASICYVGSIIILKAGTLHITKVADSPIGCAKKPR